MMGAATATPAQETPQLYTPPGRKRRKYSNDQVMLTLSLLSYRGFHDVRPTRLSRSRMRASIARSLDELDPVTGQWALSWGPAAYQSSLSLFDVAAMYVVRSTVQPNRHAVVIRGTNPISAFDWLFGDFWAGATTSWRHGDPHRENGRISLSTSLGLAMLQAMRSSGTGLGPLGRALLELDAELGDAARRLARWMLEPMERTAALTMRHVGREIRRDLKAVQRLTRHLPNDPERRVRRLQKMWTGGRRVRERLVRRLTTLDDLVGPRAQLELLSIMEGTAGLRSRVIRGPNLTGYLRHAVAAADGPVEIFVTGHSKGGALSIALAQYLRDTQGVEWVGDADRWDPERRATVRCHSFAGPTPGDTGFARLVDATFGDDCRRISNPLDIVTHAWAVRPSADSTGPYVDDIPWLYGEDVHHITALEDLAAAVVDDVRHLDYHHAGRAVEPVHGIDPTKRLFSAQAAYQHAAGYVAGLQLGDVLDTAEFFSPLE